MQYCRYRTVQYLSETKKYEIAGLTRVFILNCQYNTVQILMTYEKDDQIDILLYPYIYC
jgi:hypothetical protein